MKQVLVSVQIPTYNQKKYLSESLNSALKQTYSDLEVIVSDDCSTEYDVFEFFKTIKLDNKVILSKNEINIGRVKNYHETLFNKVKGKYFVNLDGDDYFTEPNMIEYGVNIMEKYVSLNPLMFQFEHDLVKIKEIFQQHIRYDEFTVVLNSQEYLKKWHLVDKFRHSSTIFNTEMAKECSFYDFDCIFSDFNSAAKLWSKKGVVIISSKKVSHWRVHEGNATFGFNKNTYIPEYNSIVNLLNFASVSIPRDALKPLKNYLFNKIYIEVSYGLDLKDVGSDLKFLAKYYRLNYIQTKCIIVYILKFLKIK